MIKVAGGNSGSIEEANIPSIPKTERDHAMWEKGWQDRITVEEASKHKTCNGWGCEECNQTGYEASKGECCPRHKENCAIGVGKWLCCDDCPNNPIPLKKISRTRRLKI